MEKLKSKYQAYAVEEINDETFFCFNEMSLRTFMTGASYERHTVQIPRGEQHDTFEVDLLSLHWSPLPTAEFSLNEVAMLQDVCDHLSRTQPGSSLVSVSRAIHTPTESRIDLDMREPSDGKPLAWCELLGREEGLNGPTPSRLHKVFH